MGKRGGSLWSLANARAYCRGFSRADPGTSSGDAGRNGRAGLGHALLGLPGPPEFPELWAGFSWVAVDLTQPPWAPRKRQPDKWDTSGWPGGSSRTSGSTLTGPPTHPGLFCCPVGTWLPQWSRNFWMLKRTRREALQSTLLPHYTRNTWEQAWLRYLQPLVDTLGVELVVAGEDPEQLPCLEVAEADDTPGRRAQSVTRTLKARAGSRQSTKCYPGKTATHLCSQRDRRGRRALTASALTGGCQDESGTMEAARCPLW